ncbi:MAG: hypothetical protein Q8L88_03225 [Bacteroidota bacterium]|nr:hypothetical protein [Bacteroidota bacterium]
MLRFLAWMIIFYIGAKIVAQIIRSIRIALTPNKDVMNSKQQPPKKNGKIVEDIPYEEVKDKL